MNNIGEFFMLPYRYSLRIHALDSQMRARIADIPSTEAAARRLAMVSETLDKLAEQALPQLNGEQRLQLKELEQTSEEYVSYCMDCGFVNGLFAGLEQSFFWTDVKDVLLDYIEAERQNPEPDKVILMKELDACADKLNGITMQPMGMLAYYKHRAEIMEVRAFETGFNYAAELALKVLPERERPRMIELQRKLRFECACFP